MGNLRQKYTEEEWYKLLKNDKVNSRNFEKREEELKEEKNKYLKPKKLKDLYTFVEKLQVYQKELEKLVKKTEKKVNKTLSNIPVIFEEVCEEGVKIPTANEKGVLGDPKQGVKLSSDKPPMAQLFKQFPLAFEQLALRSKMGHEKYKETDKDWMNWKRVPNAVFEYEQAKARHMLKIGEETDFEHLIAEAWNIMAIIQLKLENR